MQRWDAQGTLLLKIRDAGSGSKKSSASSLPFGREVFERLLNKFIDPRALFLRLVEIFHRAFNPGSPEQLL
jgi:hypothetical protein